MGPSARLLRLLSLLQTPRDWTGAELAERLEVSPRTVRHDIERLRALGYPVHANRGAIGGYRLEPGANLPPLLLEDDEAVAVAVGLRTGGRGAVTGIEETSLRALAKVEQVLPTRLRSQGQRAPDARPCWSPIGPGRRSTPTSSRCWPPPAAIIAAPVRLRGSARRCQPASRASRTGWSTRGGAGTSSPGTTTGPTGGPSGSIGSGPYLPLGPRFAPRTHLRRGGDGPGLARRAAGGRRYQARVVVHAPAPAIADRIGPWVGTVEADGDARCILDTGADSLELLAVHLGMLGGRLHRQRAARARRALAGARDPLCARDRRMTRPSPGSVPEFRRGRLSKPVVVRTMCVHRVSGASHTAIHPVPEGQAR